MTPWVTLREWWQWLYAHFCTFIYFDRVELAGNDKVPHGPVLFLGTHRNGILDALVYSNVLGRMTFILAKRLHKSILGRLFFGGIGVVREQDAGDRQVNRKAFEECKGYLKAGSKIFLFPEGKSALGPKLLDIKPGAAKIALDALEVRPDLKIIPLSVAYERPWGFRSRVEVRMGAPILLDDLQELPKSKRFKALHLRICDAMHEVASEYDDGEEQEACEVAANMRRMAGLSNYSEAVRSVAHAPSDELVENWKSLREEARSRGLARYNRIPLISSKPLLQPVLKALLLGPFVLAMMIANAPVLAAARFGATRLADERNVISLFRLVIGLPLMFLWGALTFGILASLGWQMVWFWSLAVSLIGLGAYDSVLRSVTVLRNARRRRTLDNDFRNFAVAAGLEPGAL